ncbi:MAG: hypothetical protein IPK26_23285 [Planctomycetes bacterium]|nr:hypothetical protein [Planctomycetota bacterium]
MRFTLTLYLIRWIVLLPMLGLLHWTGPAPESEQLVATLAGIEPWRLLPSLLLIEPALETLVECSVPWLVLQALMPGLVGSRARRRVRGGRRAGSPKPWPFVAVAAVVMVLLHPLEPVTMLPTAVTGGFLGHTYGHFAPRSHVAAFVATTVFHAGINAVGFAVLVSG